MGWTYWPARLEVDGKAEYRELDDGPRPGHNWYQVSIWITIMPWVKVFVHNFYLVIDQIITAPPSNNDLARGFLLNPSNPIKRQFTFNIYTGSVSLPEIVNAYIVLEAGVRRGKRAIKKPVTLTRHIL